MFFDTGICLKLFGREERLLQLLLVCWAEKNVLRVSEQHRGNLTRVSWGDYGAGRLGSEHDLPNLDRLLSWFTSSTVRTGDSNFSTKNRSFVNQDWLWLKVVCFGQLNHAAVDREEWLVLRSLLCCGNPWPTNLYVALHIKTLKSNIMWGDMFQSEMIS